MGQRLHLRTPARALVLSLLAAAPAGADEPNTSPSLRPMPAAAPTAASPGPSPTAAPPSGLPTSPPAEPLPVPPAAAPPTSWFRSAAR